MRMSRKNGPSKMMVGSGDPLCSTETGAPASVSPSAIKFSGMVPDGHFSHSNECGFSETGLPNPTRERAESYNSAKEKAVFRQASRLFSIFKKAEHRRP